MAAVGLLLPNLGIAAINALIVAFLVHILLAYLFKKSNIKYELGGYEYREVL